MENINYLPFATIAAAFVLLKDNVHVALHTQLGDAAQLQAQINECGQLLVQITQHAQIIPPADQLIMQQGIDGMIADLEEAKHRSADLPDAPPHNPTTIIHNGKRGRPRIEIDPDVLATSLQLRRPFELTPVFNASARTIRRRALEHGFVEPGDPVYVDFENDDGTIMRIYTSSTGAQSDLTDQQLDAIMLQILLSFPDYGRRMIDGHLRYLGHRVPRSRIQASYARVNGPPVAAFGIRRIKRRVYCVAGYNSLSHHDGQHGLIRYKIVVHGFIDGYSRFITGIRASNNNRAATVLDLFLAFIPVHGLPSRVRGDLGGENVDVAAYMEEKRGSGRGSYIWGRSVHNIRIERLWCDYTAAVGSKWKSFFEELEYNCGLNPDLHAHIWLIHHLFLNRINANITDWANSWNNHKMTIPGQGQKSPHDLRFFSMLQNGVRGFESEPLHDDLGPDEIGNYGIDWDAYHEPRILTHHNDHNAVDPLAHNPFVAREPGEFNLVEVVEPDCPLSDDQLHQLMHILSGGTYGMAMSDNRRLWVDALAVCTRMNQQQ